MKDNYIKVKMENGTDIILEVLDLVDNMDNNKTYIVYKLDNADDIYISILDEKEDSYSIVTIEDMNEFNAVQNFLIEKLEENSGEMTL